VRKITGIGQLKCWNYHWWLGGILVFETQCISLFCSVLGDSKTQVENRRF